MVIPYGRQAVDEQDIAAVVEILRGDWLTQGPTVREFEDAFAAACDAPYAVSFSSGTAALHAAAFAAGVGPQDELLTSALTFSASANCGAYVGATPTFADIDPGTWNVSVETVAAATTDATRVVVPVHFAGLPPPVREIRERAGDRVLIIEDAAHALGARTSEEKVGACKWSDMAMFSLHPVKAIATGEGGMVTTRRPELRDRLMIFRNHGFDLHPPAAPGGWYREQVELGFNYRLSDIHSALGRSQLRKLDRFIAGRNEVAARYRDLLRDVPEIGLPPAAPDRSLHAYHLFVITLRDGAEARLRLYDGLRKRGILAQVHYLPVYLHPYYNRTFGYQPGLCPQAEDYYSRCLSLPCFPTLTRQQQDQVVEAVREIVTS